MHPVFPRVLRSGEIQVATAEQVRGAVPHFELELRQVFEIRGMVTGKGVAAYIRYPV